MLSGTYSCIPFEPLVFGEALELPGLEQLAQQQRHVGALHDRRRRTRIEVERQRGGPRDVLGQRQRGVQLQVGEVGEPDERGQVARQREVDRALAGHDRHGLHPVGPVRRGLLLVEELLVHAVRVALQRQRAVAQMRQQHRRDARVVVDHLALGEAHGGVEHLVQVREPEASAPRPPPRRPCWPCPGARTSWRPWRACRAGPASWPAPRRRRWRRACGFASCRRRSSARRPGSARARPSGPAPSPAPPAAGS